MKRPGHSSLFRRLLSGFVAVMVVTWLCIMGWEMYLTGTAGKEYFEEGAQYFIKNDLFRAQLLLERPKDLPIVLKRLEDFAHADSEERGVDTPRSQLELWKDDELIYVSADRGFPERAHERGAPLPGRSLPNNPSWASWVDTDPASGLTARRTVEIVSSWKFSPAGIAYFVLPLLCSFLLLLMPVWFIIRIGLRPLQHIGSAIEERSAFDLTPLAIPPYKELSPIVASINRLMARLTDRLEREQEFLVDAAHELKTPLAVIQVNADALIQTEDPQRILEARAGLDQGLSRASHSVHQLLALARSEANRADAGLEPMDLAELVRDRLVLAAPLAMQRSIDIELRSPPNCILPLHRESLVSLIDNLVGNAVKYSPDHSRVMVSVVADTSSTQLHIVDQGPGIPAELHKKVFERFFRMPGQDQAGSGLGLAIAEKAAAHNNASIHLGRGANDVGLSVVVSFNATDPNCHLALVNTQELSHTTERVLVDANLPPT